MYFDEVDKTSFYFFWQIDCGFFCLFVLDIFMLIVYIYSVHCISAVGARVTRCVRSLDLTTHTSLSPIRARLYKLKLQKRCTRLAAASDKVYQLLAHGRWFSPGTPASSTTKTGRHDIAEIFLKVALKH